MSTETDNPGGPGNRNGTRVLVAAVAAVAVLLAVVVGYVLGRGDRDRDDVVAAPSPSATSTTSEPSPEPTASAEPTAPEGSPTPSSTRTSEPTPSATPTGASDVPLLWPFASVEEAVAWQTSYRAGGHEPWHLDPAQTAVSFTTGFLGFDGIDKVLASTVRGREADVSVGYATEGTGRAVAAVIRLARLGADLDAPWEVVGTRDGTLSITRPGEGSAASSPLTVGGRITGVDESIRVQIRQPSAESLLGESCCVPAGGEATPWQTSVSYTGATDPTLVVVASTGGHLRDVERFAVHGVLRS
jgi:hypothetical protein